MNESSVAQAGRYITNVFLDEGALDGSNRYPSVCAVVVDDVESVSNAIEETIHKLALRPDFRLEAAATGFRDRGFHHAEDPLIAQFEFINLIPTLDIEWWCSSDLRPSSDPYTNLPRQFQWLLEKILRNLKDREVRFVFEQNSKLNSSFQNIVDNSVRKAKYNPELVSHTIGSKHERALSIADYCISVSSKMITVWKQSCCDISKLHEKYEYRNFARIEKACSVLHPWGLPRSLSSRTSGRLLDRSYYELTGHHDVACSRMANDQVSS